MTGCRSCGRCGAPASASPDRAARCARRGLLRARAGRSAVRRRRDLARPRPGERARRCRSRTLAGIARDHRRAARLRLPCHAEAADAAGGGTLLVRAGERGDRRLPAGSRRSICRRSRSPTSTASWRCARPRRARRCRRSPMPASSGSIAFRAPPSDAELARRRPRRLSAEAGGDADALGLPVRVRHVVLPHDADAPAERRRKSRVWRPPPRRISRARSR